MLYTTDVKINLTLRKSWQNSINISHTKHYVRSMLCTQQLPIRPGENRHRKEMWRIWQNDCSKTIGYDRL